MLVLPTPGFPTKTTLNRSDILNFAGDGELVGPGNGGVVGVSAIFILFQN